MTWILLASLAVKFGWDNTVARRKRLAPAVMMSPSGSSQTDQHWSWPRRLRRKADQNKSCWFCGRVYIDMELTSGQVPGTCSAKLL